MPLYHNNGSSLPQMAQSAMSSATNAAASQQKQTTTVTKKESNFWDDLYKGARAVQAGAGAVNSVAGAIDKGVKLYDDLKIKSAYDDVAKAFAEGGYEAIQNNPDMQNYHHAQALGKFVQDRANSEKGRLEIMQKADEAADRMYQTFRLGAMDAEKAFQAGDMDRYMSVMQRLTANAPMPYRLEADGKGNFKEMFRSDEKGGWAETGRTMTPQEALDRLKGVMRGEQMILRGMDGKLQPVNQDFINAARRYMYATMLGNAENRLNPKKQIPLYDRNGNFGGMAIIQNPVDDYNSGPKLLAFGKNGKQIGMFDDYQQIMQAGLSPFNSVSAKGGRAGRGGSGRRGGGAGSQATFGKNGFTDPQAASVMHQAGFLWDAKQHNYFRATEDENGKISLDYRQPASPELLNLAANIRSQQGQSSDPLNVRGATAPNPDKQKSEAEKKFDDKVKKPVDQSASGKKKEKEVERIEGLRMMR